MSQPKNKRCKNCRFWKALKGGPIEKGECRREPPRFPHYALALKGGPSTHEMGYWPETFDDDWCGHFEPR